MLLVVVVVAFRLELATIGFHKCLYDAPAADSGGGNRFSFFLLDFTCCMSPSVVKIKCYVVYSISMFMSAYVSCKHFQRAQAKERLCANTTRTSFPDSNQCECDAKSMYTTSEYKYKIHDGTLDRPMNFVYSFQHHKI